METHTPKPDRYVIPSAGSARSRGDNKANIAYHISASLELAQIGVAKQCFDCGNVHWLCEEEIAAPES